MVKMKRLIHLMTDQRTVADIRKEHHYKYGTDIMIYLALITENEENTTITPVTGRTMQTREMTTN